MASCVKKVMLNKILSNEVKKKSNFIKNELEITAKNEGDMH